MSEIVDMNFDHQKLIIYYMQRCTDIVTRCTGRHKRQVEKSAMLLAGSLVRLMRTPVLFIPQQWKIRISSGALTPVGSTATCAAVQCRHLSSSSKSESEVSKAESAKTSSEPTIFAKILNKEIPAEFVHEDELV